MYMYQITGKNIAIVLADEIRIVEKSDPIFAAVAAACLADDKGKLDELFGLAVKKKVEYIGFKVKDDVVYVDDEDLPIYLGNRLKKMADSGDDYNSVLAFWHKLKFNPSRHSVHQLFQFLDSNHFPLTPDGNFIGYKAVKEDFTDKHTGTVDNSPGTINSIERRMVDDDFSQECSYGFHVGSRDYAIKFGNDSTDRQVIVEVDPADVVSVGHNEFTKIRVCKYKVVKEFPWDNLPVGEVYSDDYCSLCCSNSCICGEDQYEECGCDLGECECDEFDCEDDE